jgi:hypothetical protein
MKILIAIFTVMLTGCANLTGYIPSFWDDNQSSKIVDLRLSVDRLDCKQPQLVQVARIRDDLRWFHLYSLSKGSRQTDVLRLLAPMEGTVEDFYKRTQQQKDNVVYCDLKKRVMEEQAARAAKAVLGRF